MASRRSGNSSRPPQALVVHLTSVERVHTILTSRRPIFDQVSINADVVRNAIYVALFRERAVLARVAPHVDPAAAAADAGDPLYDFRREHDALIAKIDEILVWVRTNIDVNNAWDYDVDAPDGLVQRTYANATLAPLATLLDELGALIA